MTNFLLELSFKANNFLQPRPADIFPVQCNVWEIYIGPPPRLASYWIDWCKENNNSYNYYGGYFFCKDN